MQHRWCVKLRTIVTHIFCPLKVCLKFRSAKLDAKLEMYTPVFPIWSPAFLHNIRYLTHICRNGTDFLDATSKITWQGNWACHNAKAVWWVYHRRYLLPNMVPSGQWGWMHIWHQWTGQDQEGFCELAWMVRQHSPLVWECRPTK